MSSRVRKDEGIVDGQFLWTTTAPVELILKNYVPAVYLR